MPTPARPSHPRRAFTLVEVMVAVAVLALGALAAARCLEVAARAARHSALATALVDLARTRADERRQDACATAASALDSGDVHVDWESRRLGAVGHVRVRAIRTPATSPGDSATASVTRWCAS